eukprot:scaffold191_cov273-Chaetoceros_neogracile.AAC.64
MKPLRELSMTHSSFRWRPNFGYPSNISEMPPGAKPILAPSDRARSTSLLEASLRSKLISMFCTWYR